MDLAQTVNRITFASSDSFPPPSFVGGIRINAKLPFEGSMETKWAAIKSAASNEYLIPFPIPMSSSVAKIWPNC